MSKKKLTTNAGCPVADNQNDVMTAGPRRAADAERDIRGFALESCTVEGDRDY